MKSLFISLISLIVALSSYGQQSVARQWNDALLSAIRSDLARPTVHARNLFHVSSAMYDAWAAYDSIASPYLLGDTIDGFPCVFLGITPPVDVILARNEAISYAAYRLLEHRFIGSPGETESMQLFDSLFLAQGYDPSNYSRNYVAGGAAELGNYIAESWKNFGLQDGSNEQNDYANTYYNTANVAMVPTYPGNPNITKPNRWQPLTFTVFIDQGGNVIPTNTPPFLSPEWGNVVPFALNDSVKSTYTRSGDDYQVFMDPGAPPYLDSTSATNFFEEYQWGFSLVSAWSSHLDTIDEVMIDISPASIGNVTSYPTNIPDLRNFYDIENGGDPGTGRVVNPATGNSYDPQIVRRGDYGRVLAEFWADGPDSETPPGHWFTILNYVNDHPLFEKKWAGKSDLIEPLEWDVKAYFSLAGAVHDAAVASWALKGWYDYVRPISALRYMADLGQSSNPNGMGYHPYGLPLIDGLIDTVAVGDELAGSSNENVGKIKVYAWAGPDSISNPDTDMAGVDWILAENWWPYQRPTFVTPPFAGYVSGHSTFSRAAAEVLTNITGDEFFPGGMGEFLAKKNEFLVFEEGPSEDITLQWATYRDASDQCSLSRIWGGIHPPADDIPGRLMGIKIGNRAVGFAEKYFDSKAPEVLTVSTNHTLISDSEVGIAQLEVTIIYNETMDSTVFPLISFPNLNLATTFEPNLGSSVWVSKNTFKASFDVVDNNEYNLGVDVFISGAQDVYRNQQLDTALTGFLSIDTENPEVRTISHNINLITDAQVGTSQMISSIEFSEKMDITSIPDMISTSQGLSNTLILNTNESSWANDSTYQFTHQIGDANIEYTQVDFSITNATDINGNIQNQLDTISNLFIDTKNPKVISLTPNDLIVEPIDTGIAAFWISIQFDEPMQTSDSINVIFPWNNENPLNNGLILNLDSSRWVSDSVYVARYDVSDGGGSISDIDVSVLFAKDTSGNWQEVFLIPNQFSMQMNISTGIANVENAFSDFNIYPNPANDVVQLSLQLDSPKEVDISIYDALGKKVKTLLSRTIINSSYSELFSVANMEHGNYLVIMKTGQEASLRKLIIEQ